MNSKKIWVASIGLNILQVVLIMITITLVEGAREKYIVGIVAGAIGLSIINITITLLSYMYLQRKQYESLLNSIKDLEELNRTLKSQRHDYLNQMQVVYGLIDMNEYDDAKKYMNSIFKEITKLSKALKTAQPAINALLQAKMQMAEKQKVDMYLDIKTNLKDLEIEPWELCKVLANIIDNAITALQSKENDREIYVIMEQEEAYYCIQVKNNGPVITEEQKKLIFNEGYTTKKEKGHGMGLYIVSKIVEEAGGKLMVYSEIEQTIFEIHLPRIMR